MPKPRKRVRNYDAGQREDDREDPEPEGGETEDGEIVLAKSEEQIWAGFYASIVSGAAAGNAGDAVDLEILAEEADDMLRLYRDRLGS